MTTLLRRGLVAERGAGGSSGGRPPVILGFDDDRYNAFGVELDADTITVLRVNLRGETLDVRRAPFAVAEDPDGALAYVSAMVCDMILASGHLLERILGLGVAVPCPIDPVTASAPANLFLPRWQGVPVAAALGAATGLTVLVENTATVGALAEQWWGAGVGGEDLVYIAAAGCVGAGFVFRGDVYRGVNGAAGEIAHLQVDDDGAPCACGLRGCLVTRVGARALTGRAASLDAAEPFPNLASIVTRAIEGAPAARRVVAEAGSALGRCVATIVNLTNPTLVVVGGPLPTTGALFMDPLRAAVRERTHIAAVAKTPVMASALGPTSVALGAATLVIARGLERTLLDAAFS
ncbi:MAG: ROK family protein [Myxococcales bacterium]|nr:ROK family protein [Myxococcales bacterium]MCB9735019.1 ROK family protein [Deltaproteobacteria bacterium]